MDPGELQGAGLLQLLGLAFALMLVLEGLLPLLSPSTWRETLKRATELRPGQIRFVGLVSIVIGVDLFWILQ